MFDPERLPLPDLGLSCKGCRYPLASASRWECPECGRPFTLDEYIPRGNFPRLIAGGELVRATPEVRALLSRYHIPAIEQMDAVQRILGGVPLPRWLRGSDPVLCVPRDRWFEAVDLIRRMQFDEPMPPEPELRTGEDWTCPDCGEANPVTFDVCWNCETPRPQ